jgi:hypothetical protein
MNVKEKVRSIICDIIQQQEQKDTVHYLVNMLLAIDHNLIINEPTEFKKQYLLDLYHKNNDINISFEDITIIIDYLESIEIMQKLIQ